jgi:hypothetical protein
MLIFEVDQGHDFVSDLENAINLYIRQSDVEGSVADVNYETLSQWLQRSGSYGSVNRKIIDAAVAKSPSLKNMITNYDNDSVTLNTVAAEPADAAAPQPDLEKTDQGISKTTQQAASRAAQSGLTN